MKRAMLGIATAAALGCAAEPPVADDTVLDSRHGKDDFDVVEATIAEIHQAYRDRTIKPKEVIEQYLDRIDELDDGDAGLNAVYDVNPWAKWKAGTIKIGKRPLDPLTGIAVLLKDNIDEATTATTAGSVALEHSFPLRDAFLVKKLRHAGAIILGKATLTEFAQFMSFAMPAGYSSLAGFGFNPYDPRVDPRPAPFDDGRPALSPSGSSSGSAIAVNASLATVAIGTDTSGSLSSPALANGLIAIRPTLGLVSRSGILPITGDMDTAGPIARSVADAATVLGVIAGYDPDDPATAACLVDGNCHTDYTRFLATDLTGIRIAVPQAIFWGGLRPDQVALLTAALDALTAAGAEVVPFEPPGQIEFLSFPPCLEYGEPDCSTVMLYGFKRDLDAYLGNIGPWAPRRSLDEVRAYNLEHADSALRYGQPLFDAAAQMNLAADSADTQRYQSDLALDHQLAGGVLDAAYAGPDGTPGTDDDFDAVLFPAARAANLTARAGHPTVVVTAGLIANLVNPPFPDGFDARPVPFGFMFAGPRFSEPTLIGIASAFEAATAARVPPEL